MWLLWYFDTKLDSFSVLASISDPHRLIFLGLVLDTTDILCLMTLGCGGCPMHCGMFSSIPGLWGSDSSPCPSELWQPKHLWTLPDVSWGEWLGNNHTGEVIWYAFTRKFSPNTHTWLRKCQSLRKPLLASPYQVMFHCAHPTRSRRGQTHFHKWISILFVAYFFSFRPITYFCVSSGSQTQLICRALCIIYSPHLFHIKQRICFSLWNSIFQAPFKCSQWQSVWTQGVKH